MSLSIDLDYLSKLLLLLLTNLLICYWYILCDWY